MKQLLYTEAVPSKITEELFKYGNFKLKTSKVAISEVFLKSSPKLGNCAYMFRWVRCQITFLNSCPFINYLRVKICSIVQQIFLGKSISGVEPALIVKWKLENLISDELR